MVSVSAALSAAQDAANLAVRNGFQLIAPNRVNVGGQQYGVLSGAFAQTTRIRVDPLFSSSKIRLRFSNYIAVAGSGEQPAWTPMRLRVFLEYLPASGSVTSEDGLRVPVLQNGSQTIIIDTYGEVDLDTAFNVVAGTPFFVRVCRYAVNTAMIMPYGHLAMGGTGEGGMNNGEGTFLGDVTEIGTVTQGVSAGYGPSAIMGATSVLVPSAGLSGDSIITGAGDAGFGMGTGAQSSADGGWLVRGLIGQTTLVPVLSPAGPKCPIVRASTGGETLTGAISGIAMQYGSPRRKANLALATTIFSTYGINDFSIGTSLASLQALVLQDAAYWLRQGKKYVRATLFPCTASSNGWIDVAGQSFAITQRETDRKAFNSWVRDTSASGFMAQALAQAGIPSGAKIAIIDPAAVVEVNSSGVLTLNGGYWAPAVNGGAALASGTFTTGTATASYIDSSKSWAQDQWRGYMVRFTSGAAVNTRRTIATNNATRIRCVIPTGGTAPEPSSGDTYVIDQAYTEDGTHPSSFAHATAASATGPVAFVE